jgi:hypothetical protein
MNVYPCVYRGIIGYCCRLRGRRWLFVPELGQPDRNLRRDVSLRELVFADRRAQQYETEFERTAGRRAVIRFLKALAGLPDRPVTVAGLLFTAG